MAVADYAIVSLVELKRYMNISDTTEDTALESYIDMVSSHIETYCDRKIAVQSVSSEIHDGDGSSKLYTHYYPITQLSTETTPSTAQKLAALQYRDSPDSSWTDIEDDYDHVFLDTRKPYIELYEETFYSGHQNIKVSYKAGYSTIPGDIKQVCLEMIVSLWNDSLKGENRLGKQSVSNNDMPGISRSTSFLRLKKEWQDVLDRYRNVTI